MSLKAWQKHSRNQDEHVANLAKFQLKEYPHIQKELLGKVITENPSDSIAYNNLGTLLKAGEEIQVQLQEGPRTFNRKQLYLKAIELDNAYAYAYCNLGTLLKAGEEIQVQLQEGP